MADPFVGEIKLVSFPFAPNGWAKCDGQILNVSDYQVLGFLLGSTYGGDGTTTFGLPDLRGRVPVGITTGIPAGATGGEETHVLTTAEMPAHGHPALCNDSNGNQAGVSGAVWASDSAKLNPPYRAGAPNANMNPASVVAAGGGLAHDNMQPYTVANYIISLYGVYPSA